MSKRSHKKREALLKKKSKSRNSETKKYKPTGRALVPNAQTLMHTMQINFKMQEKLLQDAADQMSMLFEPDADIIQQLERAPSLQEVLDLTPKAIGLAKIVWFRRMRNFGPSAAPVIAQWFRSHVIDHPNDDHTDEQEKCLAALGWCDEAGIEALLNCWDDFDDYGRSLACVMLGLLGAHNAADRIWDFYQETKGDADENLFVGALWGLIDLHDQRATDELFDLLISGQDFYELFGFLSLAGDQRALYPLMYLAMKDGDNDVRAEASWALCCIGHRLGRQALMVHMSDVFEPNDTVQEKYDAVVDRILGPSEADAKEYFPFFYKDDLNEIVQSDLEQRRQLIAGAEISARIA